VAALMPYEAWTEPGNLCVSYVHDGQHGGADARIVVSQTAPATSQQYQALLEELTRLNYKVVVRRRIPSDATERRRRRRRQLRKIIGSIK
jgi:hypothetical protein